jgi:hypothetical protein
MQLFLHGTEGTIMTERTALSGIGSKNWYLMLELKHGHKYCHCSLEWVGKGMERSGLIMAYLGLLGIAKKLDWDY